MKECACCGEDFVPGDEVKVDVEEDLYFCGVWCAMEFYRINPELLGDNRGLSPIEFLVPRILA